MANRGDVIRLKRRLGFGADDAGERVVVVQADPLNRVLASLVIVPLDAAVGALAGYPGVVAVSASEAGAEIDHVAVTTQVRAIRATDLAPGAVGCLLPATSAALDRALRLTLAL